MFNINKKDSKNENISIEEKNKKKLKKIYIVGGMFFIMLSGLILTNQKEVMPMLTKMNIMSSNENQQKTYLEDNSNSDNKIDVDIDEDKKKEKISEINNLLYDVNSEQKNSNPDILKINNQYFYLYDKDVLLPLNTHTWDEYNIEGSSDGKYEKITDFYISGESPSNWTQKMSVHKLNIEDKDSFSFVDKLINGLIINITNQLEVKNIKLEEDNLSFNYIQKDKNNTLMYWEKKNISDVPDETQFVRVFVAPYSNNMYLVTYTLKLNLNSISNEDISKSLKVINSIQELKQKGK